MSLMQGLSDSNITPFVIVSKADRFSEALIEENIPSAIASLPWWMANKKLSIKQKIQLLRKIYWSVLAVREKVREWQIDLIYTNSSVIPVGRLAALLEGVPHIWHIREFGELDHNLKFVFSKLLSKALINSSSAVIFNSQAVQDHYLPVRKRKNYHVIPNGIASKESFSKLLRRKQLMPPNEEFNFLIIGAITPKKGQEQAIRAVSELQNSGYACRLLIAGSGSAAYQEYLTNLCVELGLSEKVNFLGFVEDPYDAYQQADCVLVCSENEAFGRVSAEAMSMGLPVIAKNSGGTPEIVEDGKTGMLYDDFDGLLSAMKSIIVNPDLGKASGLAGWKKAQQNYSTDKYASRVFRVITSIMEKS